jgi:hypothetical protein
MLEPDLGPPQPRCVPVDYPAGNLIYSIGGIGRPLPFNHSSNGKVAADLVETLDPGAGRRVGVVDKPVVKDLGSVVIDKKALINMPRHSQVVIIGTQLESGVSKVRNWCMRAGVNIGSIGPCGGNNGANGKEDQSHLEVWPCKCCWARRRLHFPSPM